MRRLLREPLLHFLSLGVAIFGAFTALSPADQPSSSIVVTQGSIDGLIAGFTRTWQRPPTQTEIDDLIREYVRDEVSYRQALALGLDRDDSVIRRRLRQKLEFVAEAQGVIAEPSDGELLAYLRAHEDAYRVDGRISFVHIYLDSERHGDRLTTDAEALLSDLRARRPAADPTALGDPTLLERVFENASLREVAAQLGDGFAARIAQLPTGQWDGPVPSAYGAHLVLIRERSEGRVPPLEEIRDAVRRDWMNARRIAAREEHYQRLLRQYAVTIGQPGPAGRDRPQVIGSR